MTRKLILVFNPGLMLDPQFLPVAGVDAAYSVSLQALFGQPAYKFSIVSGALPAGLSLTDNGDGTATIDGESTVAGTFEFTVRLRDGSRKSVDKTYSLQVVALPLAITGSLANMTVGTPYSDNLTIVGGVGPYTLGTTTLPAGVSASILGSTITVSGTPTGAGLDAGYSKSFDVAIPITDASSTPIIYSQSVGITVPTLVVTGTAPAGSVGAPYSYAFGKAGGIGSATYTSTGTLPPGLNLSSAGVLSGTPTTVGAGYSFSVTATDSAGPPGNVSAASPQNVAIAAAQWLYVRATNMVASNPSYVAIAEMEVRATVGGADQCSGGTPISSGDYSAGYAASRAFDNNINTEWASNLTTPRRLGYQFPTAVTVAQIAFTSVNAAYGTLNENLVSFTIEGSNNGTTWTTLGSFTTPSLWGYSETRTFNI